METDNFSFDLPPEQIAQHPPEKREDARLMVLSCCGPSIQHLRVADLPWLLPKGCVLVFNDSKVRPCRLLAYSQDSGSRVELLLLRPLNYAGGEWLVQCSRAKRQRQGRCYHLPGGVRAELLEVLREGQRVLRFMPPIDDAWLEAHGQMPLPPYIERDNNLEQQQQDRQRYQPVFARHLGSAAAPTAGLHFSEELLAALRVRGVELAFVTLHVGLGTFAPIRSQSVEAHTMHTEHYHLAPEQAAILSRYRAEGRRLIAVGTTSLRVLESCWDGQKFCSGSNSTSVYIYPGYQFKAVDELITNFHTPRSSLLLLVSALAGWPTIKLAYQEAIGQGYRFFSYGDAMWIRPQA